MPNFTCPGCGGFLTRPLDPNATEVICPRCGTRRPLRDATPEPPLVIPPGALPPEHARPAG